MAAPVVTLEVAPTIVPATGGEVQIQVLAHDPDIGSPGKAFTFHAVATSSDGEAMSVDGTVTRDQVPGDTIVGYTVTADDPDVVIVQDPADPSKFTATIPGVV